MIKEDMNTLYENQVAGQQALAAKTVKNDNEAQKALSKELANLDLKKVFQEILGSELSNIMCRIRGRGGRGGGNIGVTPGDGNQDTVARKPHKWWCHAHGVNLTHGHEINGTQYVPCTNSGPDHDVSATFRNPCQGNTKRNDKAGKIWVGNANGRNGRVVDAS